MAGAALRLGWSDPLTGRFGAHPQLGGPLDLNDGVTFTLLDGALAIEPPPRELALAGNPRSSGERGVRARYRRNRAVTARLVLGPMASASDLAAGLRALAAWVSAPPALDVALEWQAPGASAPVYLDVVGAALSAMPDELDWLRLQADPVEILFSVRPGLRGDRVWLQNLVMNPSFDTPAGPGVTVFSDTFASVGAYVVQAGGSPTLSPANTFVDTLMASGGATLLRYYRLDEASGTVVYDSSGQAQHGASHASPTLGVAGLLSGDTDTCYTLAAASSQYISVPSVGLPTGNGAVSIGMWIKFAANPASNQNIFCYGNSGTAHNAISASLNTSGQIQVDQGVGTTSFHSGVLSANTPHFVVVTWDGTTMTIYVDGASAATQTPSALTIPASPSVNIGATQAPNGFFSGQVDEIALWSGALGATPIANIWTAGHSGASGTLPNAMSVPSGARVAFGSPAWSAINTWQARLRFVTSQASTWYLHRTDASNYLAATLSGSTLALVQVIAGVSTTLATASIPLAHEVWYWLQLTQFPSVSGNPPLVQATLLWDVNGAPGGSLASIQAATADALTALAGAPQFATSGAALVLGGVSAPVPHAVSLFGPGGWQFTASEGTATGLCWGAWEQTAANCYAGGPIASVGAARMDLGPSGTVDADWRSFNGGSPTGALGAMPISTPGDTLSASVWVKSSGLSSSAVLKLNLLQFDASGTLLSTTTLQSLTGNQAAWAQLSGSLATSGSAAYAALSLRVTDTTSGSAGGVVWWDNAQCWDVTQTGQSSMPYCALRVPQSPASLVVSGLLGDLPAPAFLALGTYLASMATGTALTWALGRRALASAAGAFAGTPQGYQPANTGSLAPTVTAALDSASYGGYYLALTLTSGGVNPRAFSFAPADMLGVCHLFSRGWSAESGGNLANVQTRIVTQQRSQAWFGLANSSDQLGQYNGPWSAPLASSSLWTVADSGQVNVPALPAGALTDLTRNYLTPRAQWQDLTGGGAAFRAGWQALIPVDGSLLLGSVNNPANGPFAVSASWLWQYMDGLLAGRGGSGNGPAATYSLETAASISPAHAGGGPGTQTSGSLNVNLGADPYLTLDPQVAATAGTPGVNQLAGYISGSSGDVLPLACDVIYTPLYLYPR